MQDLSIAHWLVLIGLVVAIAWPFITRLQKRLSQRRETDREVLDRLAPRLPSAPRMPSPRSPSPQHVALPVEPEAPTTGNTTWQKALAAIGFVVVLIAAAAGGGIGKLLGKSIFGSKPSAQQIEEKLIEGFNKAAEQSNRLGPRMVDQDTRWDKTAVGPGARVTYFYSFPRYSSREVTSGWLRTNVESVVRNGVCTSRDMKPSLQYGGTYVYSYSGNDGVEIARFAFNRHDCNLPSASP